MIGLFFLVAGLVWLAVSMYLTLKVLQLVNIPAPSAKWASAAAIFTAILIGPFIDEPLGMRQFEKLCLEAPSHIRASQDIQGVERGRYAEVSKIELPGYWIRIKQVDGMYVDVDTGKPFLEFRDYFTSGGRLWGKLMLEGQHSCNLQSSREFKEIWEKYDLKAKLDKGYSR